jgi:hypothetical protein
MRMNSLSGLSIAFLLAGPAAAAEPPAATDSAPAAAAEAGAEPALALDAEAPIWLQGGLTCTLSITSSSCQGDKTKYTFSATASGCSGPYTFTWTNATRTSPSSTTMPNTAFRNLTPGEACSAQVCVRADAAGMWCQKCITIDHYCYSSCGGGPWDP